MNNDSRARSCPLWLLPQLSWRKQRRGSPASVPHCEALTRAATANAVTSCAQPQQGTPTIKGWSCETLGKRPVLSQSN